MLQTQEAAGNPPSVHVCCFSTGLRTHRRSISTSRSLRLQYPLFRFEDVRNNIDCVSGEMLLRFHFPDELGKRRVKRQDGRRWRKEEGAANGWHMWKKTRRWFERGSVKSARTRQMEISGRGGKIFQNLAPFRL